MPANRGVRAVGVDLGTTNSAAAFISESGQTAMLANELGDVLTPSVIQFADDDIIVGREATKALGYEADCIAEAAKRDIGKQFFSRQIRGRSFPPEVLEAYVLSYMKDSIEDQLGPDFQVVITVPAFFDERRRKATADAGCMAGLSVLGIVNESTAAALAFGEHLGYLAFDGMARDTMKVLVFDLGGGTFDVTVVQLGPEECVTLATDGDIRLGGRDWDARLVEFFLQEFAAEHEVSPCRDANARQRLMRLAEETKQALSARRQTTVRIESEGRISEVTVSRQQFESLTADLVERTIHTAGEVLSAARLTWSDIDRVLLVGGSTRMPVIAERLEELALQPPEQAVNPDEAVARGAAIYASYLLKQKGIRGPGLRYRVVDVNSHSLGIEGVNLSTNRKENSIIIPRNTPLPVAVTRKYVTRMTGQPSIVIHVLEGESAEPGDCISIGRAVLRDLPEDLPPGHPLEVTYAYNSEGRLRVLLHVPGIERDLTIELNRGAALSDKHLEKWTTILSRGDGFRSFEETLGEVLGIEDV